MVPRRGDEEASAAGKKLKSSVKFQKKGEICILSSFRLCENPLDLLFDHEELSHDEKDPGYVAHHKDHHDTGKNPPEK